MTENRPGEGRIVESPDLRAHLYVTALAIGGILVAMGFLTDDELQLWLNLAAALIGLGSTVLARFNVPKGRHALD
ncbi:hypothetical protein [Agrococcus sp. TF02-05]|uniref:hypothetical protein n=1 Tax=Agrococcus sp. TF02-05 TaxID=2815211 RepID=UPI001AA183DC|nr:hypothetical protein [Agrococcus sp. TF02-05]MBO1770449.1 hypothetical protein [Agrococcus sp. TF02-05]